MNYYNLLGVNPSSTKEEISSEYNYLINLICPYVDESSVLARIFIDINSSYEILSCESSKLEYNSKLSHQDIFDIENNYRKYLNTKYMFLNLNKALNQMINVTYIESGSIKTIKGYLDAVHAFNNIMLMDGKVIPFISDSKAIKCITQYENNKPLYVNNHELNGLSLNDAYNLSFSETLGTIYHEINQINNGIKLSKKNNQF